MHIHHIKPKHMGGTNDPSNLIKLTVEEHAEAHRILFEQYGCWEDEIAWKGLAGLITHEEAVRMAHKQRMSGENNHFFGVKRPEHSERMSGEGNPMFGKPRPDLLGKSRPDVAERNSKIV